MANALSRETSAYLKAHATQDIAWQPWSESVFDKAIADDKPILVSVGYLACYWCHKMASESFSDPRIIAAINRDFVAIKVDREERPDVDRSMLDAMARLGARTGWPITAFLTPQGNVFSGGSYFPPEPRYGLPGFLEVLAKAVSAYRQGEPIEPSARSLGKERSKSSSDWSVVADVDRYATFLGERLLENIDPVYGGFGLTGPRFVNASAHQFLWRRHVVTGTASFRDAVTASLDTICRSALFDHVGGGAHRYCTDDAWTSPHFEKMLYDNAQILELLTWVWRVDRSPILKICAEGIASFAIRELLVQGSGFAASLSAYDEDSGEEGGFYRWEDGAVAAILGAEADVFLAHYALSHDDPAGLLTPLETVSLGDEMGLLANCRDRLLDARQARKRPTRDEKVMADWNGLMLVALIEAGSVFDRKDWLALALQLFDTLVARLAPEGRLHHCVTDGVLGPEGFLDDYVMMSRAAVRLFEAFGKPRYLAQAVAWVATLDARFWDGDNGGYCMSAVDIWQPTPRVRTITETSLPAGNALMIGVLARLQDLTDNADYSRRAVRLVEAFHSQIVRSGIAGATAAANVQTLANFVKIKVAGDPKHEDTRALMRIALDYGLPDRLVLGPGAGEQAGKPPAVQICVATSCLAPVTNTQDLRKLVVPGALFASIME